MQKQFVRTLPSPDKIAEIAELLRDGFPPEDVAVMVFGPKTQGGGFLLAWVRAIAADPHDWDPVVDDVAVARALQGDRAVWESLTHYERREFMAEVHRRREAERAENADDRAAYDPVVWSKSGGWPYAPPVDRTPDWLENLADMVGWAPGRLAEEAKHFAAARVL